MCTVGWGEARKCRTRGSLRDAPDALREARGGGMKERERLRETRTCRAKTSLRGTPGPIVSSSDQQPAEKWSGLGRTSRTGDAASVILTIHILTPLTLKNVNEIQIHLCDECTGIYLWDKCSLYKGIPVYMGNFYVRCELITGYPSGDSKGNVNEIYSQLFYNLQEYALEAKDITHFLYKATCCSYFWAFYMQWKHVILSHE